MSEAEWQAEARMVLKLWGINSLPEATRAKGWKWHWTMPSSGVDDPKYPDFTEDHYAAVLLAQKMGEQGMIGLEFTGGSWSVHWSPWGETADTIGGALLATLRARMAKLNEMEGAT